MMTTRDWGPLKICNACRQPWLAFLRALSHLILINNVCARGGTILTPFSDQAGPVEAGAHMAATGSSQRRSVRSLCEPCSKHVVCRISFYPHDDPMNSIIITISITEKLRLRETKKLAQVFKKGIVVHLALKPKVIRLQNDNSGPLLCTVCLLPCLGSAQSHGHLTTSSVSDAAPGKPDPSFLSSLGVVCSVPHFCYCASDILIS